MRREEPVSPRTDGRARWPGPGSNNRLSVGTTGQKVFPWTVASKNSLSEYQGFYGATFELAFYTGRTPGYFLFSKRTFRLRLSLNIRKENRLGLWPNVRSLSETQRIFWTLIRPSLELYLSIVIFLSEAFSWIFVKSRLWSKHMEDVSALVLVIIFCAICIVTRGEIALFNGIRDYYIFSNWNFQMSGSQTNRNRSRSFFLKQW